MNKVHDDWIELLHKKGVSSILHIGWFPKNKSIDVWGLIFFGSYVSFLERDAK